MSIGRSMSPRAAFVVFWIVLTTFNFGFGTSELNPLQRALTCAAVKQDGHRSALPFCIEMSTTQFGYVTAGFTVGGFLGSVLISPLRTALPLILRRSKQVLIFSSLFNVFGGLVQAFAATWPVLAFGRLLMGIGSGIALVIVPGYLNDIAPPSIQGSIGVLNQLSIVIGILTAQALGVSRLGDLPSSTSSSGQWRWVPVVSTAIAIAHILLAPFASDSPSEVPGGPELKARLWRTQGQPGSDGFFAHPQRNRSAEAESLLATPNEPDADTSSERSLPVSSTLTASTPTIASLLSLAFLSPLRQRSGLRRQEGESLGKGIRMVIFTQMAQQLSGVNAVLYFSTGILSDALNKGDDASQNDQLARLIGLGITVVNFFMTFPPIPLIDENRLGRKRLLQLSSMTMAVSAAVLGISLIQSYVKLASISIVVFTAGFSAGLGPIPFLILPELVPRHAVPAASSLGIGCNWLANITLASVFLPLKQALGGKVFFLFVVIDSIIFFVITRFYQYDPPPPSRSSCTEGDDG